MRLSRLYTNDAKVMAPIHFLPGLNVVLAEIRFPENKSKDTHNLGKTTLGRVIDFCLLSTRDKDFFLFKHAGLFADLVFFLELGLLDGSYVTIRRSVLDPTKISFKLHSGDQQDFVELPESEWDHTAVAFEKAKTLLDGLLDLRDLNPWAYRNMLGYLLRTQDDYRDVFHLKKFAGRHGDWKPFLAHILGFDAASVVELYEKEEELAKAEDKEGVIKRELGGTVEDLSKIEGVLLLKQTEADRKKGLLDGFDFRAIDKEKTKTLVDDLDAGIARLNSERYSLSQNKKKIKHSMNAEVMLFDPEKASELFAEAGVLFAGQIRKDFDQLIAFNRAITEERRVYLAEELAEVESELKKLQTDLSELGARRSTALEFIGDADVFLKYKRVSDELVTLRAEIMTLERQRVSLQRLQELRTSIRTLKEQKGKIQVDIETDVEAQNSDKDSLFSSIRVLFSDAVEAVIGQKALLRVSPNQEGHLDFNVEILDESGYSTSADEGNTYRKLLCITMDLALLRAHLTGQFPRFVFHDGVFESLDDRRKESLLNVMRQYAQLGVQHIITLIDSDLPQRALGDPSVFEDREIVLRLHDEGDDGRLFKIRAW